LNSRQLQRRLDALEPSSPVHLADSHWHEKALQSMTEDERAEFMLALNQPMSTRDVLLEYMPTLPEPRQILLALALRKMDLASQV